MTRQEGRGQIQRGWEQTCPDSRPETCGERARAALSQEVEEENQTSGKSRQEGLGASGQPRGAGRLRCGWG